MRFINNKRSIGAVLRIFSASILLMVTNAVLGQEAGGTLLLVRKAGFKQYELQDHLNNSRAVVSDVKIPLDASDHTKGFKTVLLNSAHYDPFGMELPDRSYSSATYRYGFNGKEKDDEWKGSGSSYDFGARIYDPRIGRWLSTDPHDDTYPAMSPYNFAINNPLSFIDPDGKDVYRTTEFQISQARLVFVMLNMGSEEFRKMMEPFYEGNELNIYWEYDVIGKTETEMGIYLNTWAATTHEINAKGELDVTIQVNELAFLSILHGQSEDPMAETDQDKTLLALTLAHEVIHAQLVTIQYKITKDKTTGSLSDEEASTLISMADYKKAAVAKYGAGVDWNVWHHEYIAKEKRGQLIQVMKQFDESRGIKHDDEWYELMSWHGLTDTDAFKKLPKKTQKKYKKEFEEATQNKSLPTHEINSKSHF
jgi:RHS repeat-associated protein